MQSIPRSRLIAQRVITEQCNMDRVVGLSHMCLKSVEDIYQNDAVSNGWNQNWKQNCGDLIVLHGQKKTLRPFAVDVYSTEFSHAIKLAVHIFATVLELHHYLHWSIFYFLLLLFYGSVARWTHGAIIQYKKIMLGSEVLVGSMVWHFPLFFISSEYFGAVSVIKKF